MLTEPKLAFAELMVKVSPSGSLSLLNTSTENEVLILVVALSSTATGKLLLSMLMIGRASCRVRV